MKPCSIYKGLYCITHDYRDSYKKYLTIGDKVTTNVSADDPTELFQIEQQDKTFILALSCH